MIWCSTCQRAIREGEHLRTIIAVPSDTHSGSTVGLMPSPWNLEDGGTYHASPAQNEVLLATWRRAWARIAQERKRSRLIVVVNGDPVDGIHHETAELVTRRREEQNRMHIAVMDEALKTAKFNRKKGDRLYYTWGTPAHGASSSEEAIARDLGAVPKGERYAWRRLRLQVNGQVIDIAHQGAGVGRRAWTKENSLRNAVKSVYFNSLEADRPVPRFYVRSHRHVWVAPQDHAGRHGTITGIITPAMQLKTEYAHKVAGDEVLSSVGVVWLIIEDDPRLSHWDVELFEYEDETSLEVIA